MATIMSVNVCDSKYNADPTGVRDSTSAIQKAIDDVAAQGGGSVEIPGGMYRVSYPFIEMKHRVEIFGHGQATRIVAFTDKSIPSSKNGSYECTGVFHTGSYTTPMSGGTNQNKPMRMGVRDLFIRTNKYNLPLAQGYRIGRVEATTGRCDARSPAASRGSHQSPLPPHRAGR